MEFLRRNGSALKITCCPLQWWQLNNSTRGPSEKINTQQIAKMWMQFLGKVDLMWVCWLPAWSHSPGGLKHVASLGSKCWAGHQLALQGFKQVDLRASNKLTSAQPCSRLWEQFCPEVGAWWGSSRIWPWASSPSASWWRARPSADFSLCFAWGPGP